METDSCIAAGSIKSFGDHTHDFGRGVSAEARTEARLFETKEAWTTVT